MFNKDELNKLYHYALSLSKQEDTAYDLLQGALERYLMKSPQTIEKPLAYLKIIIRNLFFDAERHRNVIPMISMESDEIKLVEPFDDSSMEDLLMNQQDVQRLTSLLKPEENELLYLWAVEEHSAEEIANLYQQPRGTILSRLHRLKKRLRTYAATMSLAEVKK